MTFFKNLLAGTLIAALGLSLAADAFAQTKKKAAAKKPAARTVMKDYKEGVNLFGESGLLFAETSETPGQGNFSFSAHGFFGDGEGFSQFQVPVGVNYGIAKNFEGSAHLSYVSFKTDDVTIPGLGTIQGTSSNGLGSLVFGGKYGIPGKSATSPDFAVGGKIAIGPLSDELGENGTDINLFGTVTHKLPSHVLLNGRLGLDIVDGRGGDGDSVVKLNGGVGLPFSPKLTGIAEIGINELGDEASLLALGVRGGAETLFQIFLGLGLGDAAPDILIGGGVNFH